MLNANSELYTTEASESIERVEAEKKAPDKSPAELAELIEKIQQGKGDKVDANSK